MQKRFYKNKQIDLEKRSFRDYKFDGSTFTTRMDPSAQAMRYPVSYPIVNDRHNAMIDVKYSGVETDSDNTAAMATLYRGGPMYNSFDILHMPVGIQYLGVGYRPNNDGEAVPNVEYNIKLASTGITAISAAFATQLTDIGFLRSRYTSDIPGMTSDEGAMFATLLFYQSVVQNVASIITKFNTLLSYNDYLINLGYNAEASFTTRIMNLFKKAAVFATVDVLGTLLKEAYFDQDWFKAVGLVINVPSRAYDDMNAPLKTISGFTIIPHITITKGTGTSAVTWDSSELDNIVYRVNNTTKHYTLEGLCAHILDILDISNIIEWSRKVAAAEDNSQDGENYVNDFQASCYALHDAIAKFNAAMVDTNTFLMLLQDQTQLNSWVIGSELLKASRPRQQVEHPVDFGLVNDIISAYFSGGDKIELDSNTKKWRVRTFWDYANGIPAFDYYDGGFTIAASVRDIELSQADLDKPYYLFGVMFIPHPRSKVYQPTEQNPNNLVWKRLSTEIINRRGVKASLNYEVKSAANILSDYLLRRLILVDADIGSVRLPTVEFALSRAATSIEVSMAFKLMLQVFGCCSKVTDTNGSGATHNYPYLSPTIIGIVSREYNDFADRSTTYIETCSPLKIKSGVGDMGFSFSMPSGHAGDRRRNKTYEKE